MTTTEIEARLRKIDKQRRILDAMTVLAIFIAVAALFITIFTWQLRSTNRDYLISAINAVLYWALTAPIASHLLCDIARFAQRNFVPSYFIEVGNSVLKVHGSMRMSDWSLAARRLLAIRSDYRIVADAYREFGCTMAAVPASAEYLKSRRKLLAMGFSV